MWMFQKRFLYPQCYANLTDIEKLLIVVDDYLPVSKSGTLMCTFSTNKNELWPSIIEKAYMKLMGGYDFPGSNSGIDL